MSKYERARITINLAETVELDYSRLHLNMLYSIQNITLLSDPYSFYDNEDIAKKTVLILLNATSTLSAKFALEKWHEKKYNCKLDFAPIIFAAKQWHTPIADCFGSGIGVKLQNYDAKIAVDVVSHFTAKGIACLPIHDSFIIDKSYKFELREVMIFHYQKFFGSEIKVH